MHLKWNLPTNLQSDSSGPNPVPKLMSSCPRAGRAALLTPRGNVQGEAMCPLPFKLGLGNYCKGGGWEELNSFRKKQLVQIQRQLSLALTCQLARALSATLSTANIFLEELLWVLIQALKCSWMFISIIIHRNPDTSFASCTIRCKSKVTWSLFFVHMGVHTHMQWDAHVHCIPWYRNTHRGCHPVRSTAILLAVNFSCGSKRHVWITPMLFCWRNKGHWKASHYKGDGFA